MKPEIGTIVKPDNGFAENGIRIWNEDRTDASYWFEFGEIGFVIEHGRDVQYVKILTSSGNIGWALIGLLIPA